MQHPELTECIKFGEVKKKEMQAYLTVCECGRLIYGGSQEVYYIFEGESVCMECVENYIWNFIGNHMVVA
ncbi:MAG: hypothetical protein FWE91_10935 [Defluviitaleaceae bacterium]|nr:hypothetical protein [Defluviitaleaceae bacterium]MCL2835189.1 hypothetical protein [Defluviitaleaceae bacterium]